MGRLTFTPPRPLRAGDDVSGFRSGEPLVDSWVASRALSARRRGTAVVYATFLDGALAGFYTLSAQSVVRAEVSGWLARNAPEQVPVILLGMLGVDERWQGMGLGADLLADAARRSALVADQIGARALVVDPAGAAAAFYERHGFRPVPGSRRMFARLR